MVTSQDCFKKYGDPVKNEAKHMRLYVLPERFSQYKNLPKRIYLNQELQRPLTAAFDNLVEYGVIHELETFDGCFNIRKMRGLESMSLHSWGIAIDVNAKTNGLGMKPKLSETFVKCFKLAGFDWGGDWKRLDGMHFQLSAI